MFLLVKPHRDYKLLGTSVELDSDYVYVAIPAWNQPSPMDETCVYIIYAQDGHWDVDTGDLKYCVGFLLSKEELEIVLQTDHEMEMFEQLQEINQ